MESLRCPIKSFFFGQKMSSECLEQAAMAASSAALELAFPPVSFLQMLNGPLGPTKSEDEERETEHEEEDEESKQILRYQLQQRFHRESNFQRLLEIQARYACPNTTVKIEPFRPPAEQQQLESCVTHEAKPHEAVRPIESTAVDVGPKERRKRKRPRVLPALAKNAEEAEGQRMNHIAVERNRRRLMNSHLSTLRTLMPSSFVQRGDQASIVAGAIDFVKELEHLLLSLQAKKRMRAGIDPTAAAATSSSSASSSCTNEDDACPMAAQPRPPLLTDFFISPQYTSYSHSRRGGGTHEGDAAAACGVDVEATVVQGHVNLKVVGRRRRGQLVRGIAAMEEIGLSVLHLNIASLDDCSVLYSLNLKMEEECKLGSADEIATAVHQIFSYINLCCG